ncbi:MAG: DUF3108 domain-containing protein [Pyrinomonadaceae bacterium]
MLATAIAFCGLASVVRAQTPVEATAIPFAAAPYRVGERLTYNVSYSQFTTAAHVELSVVGTGLYNNRNGVELRARVETLGIVGAAMYSINDDYVSIVDPSTGLPFRRKGACAKPAAMRFRAKPHRLSPRSAIERTPLIFFPRFTACALSRWPTAERIASASPPAKSSLTP